MADLKAFAEQLVNLTVKEVNELAQILKDEYGIEPAAAAVAVAAGPAAAGRNCRSAAARVKAAADRRAAAASPDRTPSYFPRAPTPGTPPASAGHGRARPPSPPRSAPPARPRRPSAAPDSPNHAYHFSLNEPPTHRASSLPGHYVPF